MRYENLLQLNGRLCTNRRGTIFWTEQMLSIMRRYYSTCTDREVAGMLGLTTTTIRKKARLMRLKKSDAYLKGLRSKAGKVGVIIRELKKKKRNKNVDNL